MTQSPVRAYRMIRSQDTCAYSENAWRSSWEDQHGMQVPLGQTSRDINGNSYGKAKHFGNNTGNAYGTRVTRRWSCAGERRRHLSTPLCGWQETVSKHTMPVYRK